MDRITLDTLKERLLATHEDGCVSIFMPTHRAGREAEQDPIRLKNMLREVESRLLARGMRSPEVRAMLQRPNKILADGGFWKRRGDGLALFFSTDALHAFRLPLCFEETIVVSRRFHVKPLLQMLTSDSRFLILALSQNQVRLLDATRHTAEEVELEGLARSLSESAAASSAEGQSPLPGGTATGAGKRPAMFFGHDLSRENKDKILRWFRMIDRRLKDLLADTAAPMVLAGVDSLFALYREANTYAHLMDEGLAGNPEGLKPEELHAQAWSLVSPVFQRERQAAAARYRQLAGTGQSTADIKEAVVAAHRGRVDTLFVAVGVQVWGRYDAQAEVCRLNPAPEPGDGDLLDLAAIQSLLKGATVYAVAPQDVPDQGPLAALFRY